MRKKIHSMLFISMFLFLLAPVFPQNYVYYSKYSLKHKLDDSFTIKFNANIKFKHYYNYYRKIYGGISKKLNKNFKIGFFYAIKSKESENWKIKSYIFPQLTYIKRVGDIEIEDRNRVEYFFSSKDYKYRNRLLFAYQLNKKTELWFGEEVRYFFKDKRIGKNELLLGIKYRIVKKISLDLFYDYKSERENNVWVNTNVFGTKISFLI